MPNQTVPITLSWGPTTGDVSALDINQLGTLIAQQLSGSLRADISFIPIVTNDPAAYQGQLIFNVAQNLFKSWSIGAGAYVAISPYAVGDVKNTFIGNDSVVTGWVILNGRKISDITGLSAAQISNLQGLFGASVDQAIPSVSPANVSGLPQGNAFGNIPWGGNLDPSVLPNAGTFASMAFTNPVTDTEATALANNCETLRTSTDQAFTVTKQIQALCQQVLTALNTASTPPLYASVFIGYP